MFVFTCNVCGRACSVPSKKDLDREAPTCTGCGSSVRQRWIVHALSNELFGRSLLLTEFPQAKSISGIGMSDWEVLCERFRGHFRFRNTFLHADPKFDLLHPASDDLAAYDFIIASEILEHVPPPIQTAFDQLARVLRLRGFALLTVPWKPAGSTDEHFPELWDWRIDFSDPDGPVLVNRKRNGDVETRRDIVFHGGGGQTLEMRLFSRPSLIQHLRQAGFGRIRFSRIEEKPEFGIIWEGDFSLGCVARKGFTLRNLADYAYVQGGRLLRAQRVRMGKWKRRLLGMPPHS